MIIATEIDINGDIVKELVYDDLFLIHKAIIEHLHDDRVDYLKTYPWDSDKNYWSNKIFDLVVRINDNIFNNRLPLNFYKFKTINEHRDEKINEIFNE